MMQDQKVKRSQWFPLDNEHGIGYDSDRNRITFRAKSEGRWFNVGHLYVVDPTRFQDFLKGSLPQALANLFKKDPVEEAVEKLLASWSSGQELSSRDLWQRLKDQASPVVEALLQRGLIQPTRSEFDAQGNLVAYYKRRES